MTVVDVSGLRKRFGASTALDGLDLRVTEGEVHGFLGPNGAGKSTTLKVLLGLLRATDGTARVLGRDPWRDAVILHREIAYVPGDVNLWPNLTGGEVIDLLGRMSGGHNAARRDQLVELFELDPSKKCRSYSKGNRQKVALVAAFAAHARLLLLDEPTSGLDPLKEATFRSCIQEAHQRGVTVLLSSHILSEVDALCERVTIIKDGVTVDTGEVAEMRHLNHSILTADVDAVPGGLDRIDGVSEVSVDGHHVRCRVENRALGAVIAALNDAGVRALTCTPPSLEELFLSHYRSATRAPA